MDPVSVATGIGSICSCAVRLISTLSEFVDAVNEGPKEVQALNAELAFLYANLSHVKVAVQGPRSHEILEAWATDFGKLTEDCKDTLESGFGKSRAFNVMSGVIRIKEFARKLRSDAK